MPTRPRIEAGPITPGGEGRVKGGPEGYPQLWTITMRPMASLHPLGTLEIREPDPLQRALRAQADEIAAREAGTRLGSDPEELHKQRVATRRARSLLRSTREQLEDPDRGTGLEAELRWLG